MPYTELEPRDVNTTMRDGLSIHAEMLSALALLIVLSEKEDYAIAISRDLGKAFDLRTRAKK